MKKGQHTLWSTANNAFSAEERKEFNKWKAEIWSMVDKLRDDVHFLPDDEWTARISKKVEKVLEMVNEVPLLLDKDDWR